MAKWLARWVISAGTPGSFILSTESPSIRRETCIRVKWVRVSGSRSSSFKGKKLAGAERTSHAQKIWSLHGRFGGAGIDAIRGAAHFRAGRGWRPWSGPWIPTETRSEERRVGKE